MLQQSQHQQKMISQKQIKQILVQEYYRYVKLIYQSENFIKDPKIYEKLSIGKVTLVGHLEKIEKLQIQTENLMVPIFQTTLKYPRKLLISHLHYKQIFVGNFNMMMRNKMELYAITGLNLGFHEKNLYFLPTSQTYIIQLTHSYYKSTIQPIQKFISFNYSSINLLELYSPTELEKGEGFILQNLRERLSEKEDKNISVIGVVKKLQFAQNTLSQKRDRQLTIHLVQNVYKHRYDSLGICKVILKYTIDDEQQLTQFFHENIVYLFANPEIVITDNVKICYCYKVNNFKNYTILKLSNEIQQNDLNYWIPNLQCSTLDFYQKPFIQKNMKKFRVNLHDCEIIYASYICSECEAQMRYNQCNRCQSKAEGRIQLWGFISVVDDKALAYISIQNNQLIKFLEIEDDLDLIKQVLMKQNGPKTIYRVNKNKIYPLQGLEKLGNKIKHTFIQKYIIGISHVDFKKTMKGSLTEDEKNEFELSLMTNKQFIQQKRINLNGLIQKKNGVNRYIPIIKVMYVEDSF